MKAVGCTRGLPASNPESLKDVNLPLPIPVGRDLLISVKAVSVNPIDTKIRRSQDSEGQEAGICVLGWDVAGVVESVTSDVQLFEPGDEVYYAGSVMRSGGNCEYHVVDERLVAKKPASLDMIHAAALPLTAITAYEALFERMRIAEEGSTPGRSILIIGGAGGVGSIAIQLAKIANLHVIATASRSESQAWCSEMGADVTIDHTQSIPNQLQNISCPTVDYILNTSSMDQHWLAMCKVIKPQGYLCGIVDAEGPLDLNPLKRKSVTFAWEFMFTRSMYHTDDMIEHHKILTKIAEWVDAQNVGSTLKETLSPINAENVRVAHEKLESGRMTGKFVLSGWSAEA